MSTKLKDPYFSLLILSSGCLVAAYIIEYLMEFPVCPLCVYQRFPYLIFIMLSIMSLSSQKSLGKYYIVTIICAIILAGYHTGVENGIFEMSALCSPLIKINDNISVADFTKILYQGGTLGKCNKPALIIFKLSLTEWNLLLNLFLLPLIIKYRNN